MNVSKRYWSEEEIAQLYVLYKEKGLPAIEIAEILGRTKNSVWTKIKRLKIRHTPEQTFKIKHKNMSMENNPMWGKESWCKGETKETSLTIKNKAIKQSLTRKKLFQNGTLNLNGKSNPMYGVPSWNHGLTKENCDILKRMGKKISIAKKKEWANLSEEEKEKRRKHCAIIGAKCKKSKTTIEIKVEDELKNLKINYISNYYKSGFVFDFYLPKYNSVIECQGDYWHANPMKYSSSNINDIQRKNIERDNRKKKYLLDNNIPNLFLWGDDIRRNFNIIQNQIINLTNNYE